MHNLVYLIPFFGIIALVYMYKLSSWVSAQDAGNEKMQGIANSIADGAMAFLKAEYRILSIFIVISSILLAILSSIGHSQHWSIVLAFIFGALSSILAGLFGMKIATKGNVRTTQAAITSLSKALEVSFKGGSVMGLGVAGLAVFGLGTVFALLYCKLMGGTWTNTEDMSIVLETLAGFSLGAESIALFARVGGGIYTKAADVGADLVGKVEAGIPEDDPRNPATIADNVGDNVGDVAGMGADLFGSYVATVLASMVLGNYVIRDMGGAVQDNFGGMGPILLPMLIAGLGIIFSIIGMKLVKIDENNATADAVQSALNKGNWASIALTGIASFVVIKIMLPAQITMSVFNSGEFSLKQISSIYVFYAVVIGLIVGAVISMITEYLSLIHI